MDEVIPLFIALAMTLSSYISCVSATPSLLSIYIMISSSSESMSTSPVIVIAARSIVGNAESLIETFSTRNLLHLRLH